MSEPSNPQPPTSSPNLPATVAPQPAADLGLTTAPSHPANFADDPLAATPTPKAARFGDYEILERLTPGGMGIVYKARQLKANRLVALKTIQAGHLATADQLERFKREARAAADLHHPGIVTLYDVGEVNGQHYFSMEWLDGGSLKELVAEGPLPPREAAEIIRQAAEAIQHAHERGIIHRDIKPHNIMLTLPHDRAGSATPVGAGSSTPGSSGARAPVVKIIDLGLARMKENSDLSRTGDNLGTPSYMPPEQARGAVHEIGPRSDVYGLGAVLYHLLTGRPPFLAANIPETMRQVLEQEPVSPRRVNAAIPVDLGTVCLKCLQKETGKRYATAAELANDLGRYLRGESVRARPTGPMERWWKWCRRNPVVAALTVAVWMLLVGGFVGAWILAGWALGEAKRADARAEGELREAELARGNLYVSHMHLARIAWEASDISRTQGFLDPYRNPAPGTTDPRGFEWYYLDRLCHLDLHTIELGRHWSNIAISPDGQRFLPILEMKTLEKKALKQKSKFMLWQQAR